jgi:hypothetical protein
MKTSNWMKRFAAIASSALMGLTLTIGANAANPEQVPVEVTFVSAITIGEDSALQFGLLDVAMALNDEVIIAPNDGLTDLGGNVLGGSQTAADLTITATAGVTINIDVDVVSVGTGYTLGTWMCEYEAQSATACDGAGWNVTSTAPGALRVGVTLTGNGLAVAGNQDGVFDVTVTYQ